MIGPNDLKTILLKEVKPSALGKQIPAIELDEFDPVEEFNVPERIVIVVNASDNEDWQKTYAHVCAYIPKNYLADKKTYKPNKIRLTEIERICGEFFMNKRFVEFNGETVYYRMEQMQTESDPETWSDFVNVRLKITNSNFKF